MTNRALATNARSTATRACARVGPVVVAALVASCVSWRGYPDEWPALEPVAEGRCPHLAGLYRNYPDNPRGQCPVQNAWGCSLTFFLLVPSLLDGEVDAWRAHMGNDLLDGVTHVRILQRSDSELEIHLLNNGEVVHRQTLSREHGAFACTTDGLSITRSSFRANLVNARSDRRVLTFRTSVDRSLVVKVEQFTGGHILLIPAYGQARFWQHWNRVGEGGD